MSATFEKHYNRLNKQQKKAVDTIEGPVLVVAGPGSGKTEILSMRVANILKKTDAPASSILCLTFTESAAINMRQRLADLIGQDAYRVAIHTFHSFGTEIIQENPEYFHEGTRRNPANEVDQTEILQEIFSNMSHDNPLNSVRPDGEFVYLSSALSHISNFKKAGLNPKELRQVLNHNEQFASKANSIFTDLFAGRMSKSTLENVPDSLDQLQRVDLEKLEVPMVEPLQKKILSTLSEAYAQARELDTTKPVTNWRNEYLEKNGQGDYVIKSYTRADRLQALADVYEKYQQKLKDRNLYDFDDMILDVVHTLEEESTLRFRLQEKYLYTLIDEFQDTNDAQMRLINSLANMDITEGRPNIMAVGDDDQSIFKFQGANIDNILNFSDNYVEPKIITLKKNYRSNQKILDQARDIITSGQKRLEEKIDEVDKELISAHPDREEGNIFLHEEKTQLHEFDWIASEIRDRIEEGESPDDIAVITRRHKTLQNLVPILQSYGIPISYEKRQNVFEQKHIQQVVTILRFVDTLFRKDKTEADEHLPDILSFEFWNLDRVDVWRLSTKARATKPGEGWKLWLDVMVNSEQKQIRDIAHFLLELGKKAKTEPAEDIIAYIIGTKDMSLQSNDGFVSPFKEYYFSDQEFENNKQQYIDLLSNLKTFIDGVREYKQEQTLRISDVIEYVDLHQKNNIELTDNSPYSTAEEAVNVLSTHKSKGMEFDTVFVVSCQDKEWVGSGWSSTLPLPKNLPIDPGSDTLDDRLRLFYVALTRAKENVYMTYYKYKDNGKESPRLRFFEEDGEKKEKGEPKDPGEIEAAQQQLKDDLPRSKEVLGLHMGTEKNIELEQEEKALLEPILEDYKLSVTHFNNFLNVVEGGPQEFLEKNLLRFPQPKPKPAMFGSAMHSTLEEFYLEFKKREQLPDQRRLLELFEQELNKEELVKKDFEDLLKKGKDSLSVYYKQKKDDFDPEHIIEFSFRKQGVKLEDAHLRGKIDKMEQVDEKEYKVYDFKTGSPLKSWNGRSKYDKIKAWRYKNQLIFYKILVENSRKFGDKFKVHKGGLEFLEPEDGEIKELSYHISSEEIQRVSKLANIIYNKVNNLDFPDVSSYDENMSGIEEFERDLLSK